MDNLIKNSKLKVHCVCYSNEKYCGFTNIEILNIMINTMNLLIVLN